MKLSYSGWQEHKWLLALCELWGYLTAPVQQLLPWPRVTSTQALSRRLQGALCRSLDHSLCSTFLPSTLLCEFQPPSLPQLFNCGSSTQGDCWALSRSPLLRCVLEATQAPRQDSQKLVWCTSFRDHCPALPLVQCPKMVLSYISFSVPVS